MTQGFFLHFYLLKVHFKVQGFCLFVCREIVTSDEENCESSLLERRQGESTPSNNVSGGEPCQKDESGKNDDKFSSPFHKRVNMLREAAKKILLLMAGPLRGGGGGILRKKRSFFGTLFFQHSKVPTTIKLEGH